MSVRDARFNRDDVDSIVDALDALGMHNTRASGVIYKICFSYKTFNESNPQKKGNGSNRRVTLIRTELIKTYGLSVHMRNGRDDVAEHLREESFDIDDDEWFVEWGVAAHQATLVVCFVDAGYKGSKACMKEYNFCKDNGLKYIVVDDYKVTPTKEIAAMINNRYRDLVRKGS